MKRLLITLSVVLLVLLVSTVGASYYMLDYSLAPDAERSDTALRFRQLTDEYPEVKPWLDSLKACHAFRDTFVVMPTGEKHHAYYVSHPDSRTTALIIHGWRDCAIDFLYLARIYSQLLGCHVLLPDLHGHGLSEGAAVGMGWHERHDVLHWIEVASGLFKSNDFVVHGVSMGAATTMNVSGEKMPAYVRSMHFVEDCGYTSVWDEFSHELNADFHLPPFPLMFTTSLLCRLHYGWSFGEAAPLRQVRRCRYPMLFIHGDRDDFVPTRMVYALYEAKPGPKSLWITKGCVHARSYAGYPDEYAHRLSLFLNMPLVEQ